MWYGTFAITWVGPIGQKKHCWCLLQWMSKESEQTKCSKENGARKQVGNGALELDLNKDESMK